MDARQALDIYGDRRVMTWLEDGTRDLSIRQTQVRLQRYADQRTPHIVGSWAVEQKDIGRVVGSVMLTELPDLESKKPEMRRVRSRQTSHSNSQPNSQPNSDANVQYTDGMPTDYVEIGWHFRPASWGFGYATEAARLICQHAFETLKLPLLLAVSDPTNKRSVALMERLGMQNAGITTRYYGGRPLLLYKLEAPQHTQEVSDRNPS